MKLKIQLLIIMLILLALTTKSTASLNTYNLTGAKTSNKSNQNYEVHAEPIKSYLYENPDKTITRVEYIESENSLLIETYDNSYTLRNTKKIKCSLPIFGGFHSGSNYNFIVLGRLNLEQDNKVPVYRIEKYSKNWQKLGTADLNGKNTILPFNAGSLRIAEDKDTLYIETCHKMYKTSDGLCHQANVGIELNIETMKIEYARTGISYIGTGYVTHSFNQFIQTENGYTYTVNHGDAYPRSIVLIKRTKGATWVKQYAETLKFPGNIGDNNTGTSIGGFELSANNCIIAGNSILKNTETLNKKAKRNIFVNITQKENIEEQTKTIWLTNYSNESDITPSTPHLVKINNNRFVILWEEYSKSKKETVKATLIDEKGTKIAETIEIEAELSDCKPIIHKNNLVWYTSENQTKATIYTLDVSNDTAFANNNKEIQEKNILGDANDDGKIDTKDARLSLLCYVGKEKLTPERKTSLDINQDGKVDTKDARKILLHYVGKETIPNNK